MADCSPAGFDTCETDRYSDLTMQNTKYALLRPPAVSSIHTALERSPLACIASACSEQLAADPLFIPNL